jgi:hypothetical protein
MTIERMGAGGAWYTPGGMAGERVNSERSTNSEAAPAPAAAARVDPE